MKIIKIKHFKDVNNNRLFSSSENPVAQMKRDVK